MHLLSPGPDPGAEDGPAALLAEAGHPGAAHPAHPTVAGVVSLLGWWPALSVSGDAACSLLIDGLLLTISSLLAASSRPSLLWVSSLFAVQILFSKSFIWSAMRVLSLQSSVVPFAVSLSIPSLAYRRAACSFPILHQTSFILSLSVAIILVHLSRISLNAGDLLLPSGVTDLLLLLGSMT